MAFRANPNRVVPQYAHFLLTADFHTVAEHFSVSITRLSQNRSSAFAPQVNRTALTLLVKSNVRSWSCFESAGVELLQHRPRRRGWSTTVADPRQIAIIKSFVLTKNLSRPRRNAEKHYNKPTFVRFQNCYEFAA